MRGTSISAACSVVDEHVHAAVSGDQRHAVQRAAAVAKALGPLIGAPIRRPHISPIEGRLHLDRIVTYFLRQSVKHGLPGHPAAWPGSCLADLIGVRSSSGFSPDALRAVLPRLTAESILRRVDLDLACIHPADDDTLFAAGPVAVVHAATAALNVPILDLSRDAALARRAAAQFLTTVSYRTPAIARATHLAERSVRALRSEAVPADVLTLVRRRVTFDRAVASAPPVTLTDREREALRRSPFR